MIFSKKEQIKIINEYIVETEHKLHKLVNKLVRESEIGDFDYSYTLWLECDIESTKSKLKLLKNKLSEV